MIDDFDAAREPMRAIRDLINACEMEFPDDKDILGRARAGFATLRAEFGDNRPGEDIADARMHEPRGMRAALELTSGALQAIARGSLKDGERHIVRFNGRWLHIAPISIANILDRADAALDPVTRASAQGAIR